MGAGPQLGTMPWGMGAGTFNHSASKTLTGLLGTRVNDAFSFPNSQSTEPLKLPAATRDDSAG